MADFLHAGFFIFAAKIVMIQRIQSIFLLLAGVAAAGPAGLPFASTDQAQPDSALFADASYTLTDKWSLLALFGLSALLWITGIFLFRNRPLQKRLTFTGIAFTIIGAIFAGWYFSQDPATALAGFGAGSVLPPLAVIFAFLAYRYISRDHQLVRSMDRLR
jgi:hypothetical protein